jgi:vacuolar-type H+-ATPase subunit H
MEDLKRVKAAEDEARGIIAEAQQNAKKIVSDAEKAGAEAMEAAVERAESEIAALMKATEAKAGKNAEELMQNTYNKCAAKRVKAESRAESAASYIVRRVVEG